MPKFEAAPQQVTIRRFAKGWVRVSYARFGQDGSDVYVYMSVRGHLECCGCIRATSGDVCPRADSTEEMVTHLQQHIEHGDTVPDYVIPDLRGDDAENRKYFGKNFDDVPRS